MYKLKFTSSEYNNNNKKFNKFDTKKGKAVMMIYKKNIVI